MKVNFSIPYTYLFFVCALGQELDSLRVGKKDVCFNFTFTVCTAILYHNKQVGDVPRAGIGLGEKDFTSVAGYATGDVTSHWTHSSQPLAVFIDRWFIWAANSRTLVTACNGI